MNEFRDAKYQKLYGMKIPRMVHTNSKKRQDAEAGKAEAGKAKGKAYIFYIQIRKVASKARRCFYGYAIWYYCKPKTVDMVLLQSSPMVLRVRDMIFLQA